jgi:hypothetical protein
MLVWQDGEHQLITEDKPAPEFAANAPLYGSKEDGTFKLYIDGVPSDIVSGLGLPAKHHVSFRLTFQRNAQVSGAPVTPVPSVEPTSTPAPPPPGGGGSENAVWDPRLDDLGITLKKAQSNGLKFRIKNGRSASCAEPPLGRRLGCEHTKFYPRAIY